MEKKKRCPKCGEENPPEAVMCWACYTPLNAGAGGKAVAQTKAKKPARVDDDDDDDDDDYGKPKTPVWQYVVIAFGLMFGLYTVGKNFLPTGSGSDGPPPPTDKPTKGSAGGDAPAPTRTPSQTSSPDFGKTSSVPKPKKLPFTIALPPSPNYSVGTMAIVPNDPNISTQQAGALASFMRSQFTRIKRWKKLYIYVFRNADAAKQFASYQRQRKGAPLSNSDYGNLTSVWGQALACYEYNEGKAHVYTPTNDPSGWWNS